MPARPIFTIPPGNKRAPLGSGLRFLRELVASPPDECVLWPFGCSSNGYGRVRVSGIQKPAHRVALELHQGHDPGPDFMACHDPVRCNTPRCVNPLHLRFASASANQRDRAKAGTNTPGEGMKMGRAKLTPDDVRYIRRAKESQRDLAHRFGVGETTVWSVRNFKTWKGVK